jgi:pimeloyl-ACP methyl ester carboxylesterase
MAVPAANRMQPFSVAWSPDQVIATVRAVEDYASRPNSLLSGWKYGCDPRFIDVFCEHWRSSGNISKAEHTLNRYPQFLAEVDTDMTLHFVYVRGEANAERPLLMLHGWPGSHFEFWDVIDALAFPSRFGNSTEAAFDLIIPSLPGYGFSSKPSSPIGARTAANWLAILMHDVLGFGRYLVHGNDWGSAIAPWMALDQASGTRAIHFNQLAVEPAVAPQTTEEKRWVESGAAGDPNLSAYYQLHTSKPQSLALLAAGNPVGQASWLLERFHDWSDLGGRSLEAVFGLQKLLTNVLIYVMTDSFPTSTWFYAGSEAEKASRLPEGVRIEIPTGVSNWSDPRRGAPPRTWVERGYDLMFWSEHVSGGHFPAMQAPEMLIGDLRQWAQCVVDASAEVGSSISKKE